MELFYSKLVTCFVVKNLFEKNMDSSHVEFT